jgi:hypothetical protein
MSLLLGLEGLHLLKVDFMESFPVCNLFSSLMINSVEPA